MESSGLANDIAEADFDDLAGFAAGILRAPLGFVTVVDEHRSWFKGMVDPPVSAPRSTPVEESFCQYVIGSGEPLVVTDARVDPRTCDNPAVATMGVAAWAGYPIRSSDGSILGTLCVVDTEPRQWSQGDLQVLDALSRAASRELRFREVLAAQQLALARQTELAHTLQRSLLPPVHPDIPGLDVAATFVAAGAGDEVVGDFYDVFPIRPGLHGVVLGDVCGKGPAAASVTALARYTLRAAATWSIRPRRILESLNAALLDQQPDGDRLFVTAAYATVRATADDVAVTLALGGHHEAIVVDADGTSVLRGRHGTLLGVFDEVRLAEERFRLRPGQSLVLYTDGATEARHPDSGEPLGDDRFRRLVEEHAALPAAELAQKLQEDVAAYRGRPARDDTAILVIRRPPS